MEQQDTDSKSPSERTDGLEAETAFDLRERLHDELWWARKQRRGLTPAVMAECSTLCALMGDGDPELAQAELGQRMYEYVTTDDDADAIEALYYSLGYTGSDAQTHTRRLDEYAADRGMELRQARRYSDQGIEQAISLIVTRWLTRTIPELAIHISQSEPETLVIQLEARWQYFLAMHEPVIQAWREDQDLTKDPLKTIQRGEEETFTFTDVPVTWEPTRTIDSNGRRQPDGLWREMRLTEPACQPISRVGDTSVLASWQGPVWPKLTTILTGDIEACMIKIEAIGTTTITTFTR